MPARRLLPRSPEAPALDLPDLDKAEDGDEVDVGVFELDMGEELDLEDGDGVSDGFEVPIQEQEDAGSDEPAHELEIGIAELLDALPEEGALLEPDAPVPVDHELDQLLEVPLESDDVSSDLELGDDGLEELPELVSEDGDGDAGPELEGSLLAGAPEGAIPEGERLEAEWLLLGTACTALWALGSEVLASAEQLMRFGQERKSTALPTGASASSLCVDASGSVVLVTSRGLMELLPGGAASTLEAPEPARGSGADVAEVCGAPGLPTLWARLTSGALLRRRGGHWERHEAGGAVRSLRMVEQQITLLVVSERPTLQLSTDGGSSFHELLLPDPAATVALGSAPSALSLGRVVALFDPERGLCVSNDDGRTFQLVTGAVNVTAATVGQLHGKVCVFAALYREARDRSELIAVDPGSGAAEIVAELSGEPDEDGEETGRSCALLVADDHLWAAGGFGLAKLR